ncbi:MAG: hypothetical protein EBZ24_13755, partial [Synechococcaceae bacterium WB9_4xB_025]|nr:hypothetical protein [Synechococcaceae bacterium WB9_4xB_025]
MARVAWLSLNPAREPPSKIEGVELVAFNALAPLLEQEQGFDVVVLDGPAEAMGQTALLLRSDERYHLVIIYTSRPGNAWCDALTDGELPGSGAAIEAAWQQWR